MAADPLAEDIKSFILNSIDSVAELETLTLCFESRAKGWTPSDVSERLRSSDASATLTLAALTQKGLLIDLNGAFQCAPFDDETNSLVERVIAAYRERKVSMITLIYDKPSERIRSFADAFKIRKDT